MNKNYYELNNLSDISDGYDGILSDIWGVLHNGIRANEQAVAALVKYRQKGGKVILITNASRTRPAIQKMLDNMNISRDAYDGIVTSGDVTKKIVASYKGQIIHHVGPEMDNAIFDNIDVTKGIAKNASCVVVTGFDDDEETPDDYDERLKFWLELKLPMICTNPDAIVEIGDKIYYCPGSIADKYEQIGGEVLQAGKPFSPIYEASFLALQKAGIDNAKQKKILAIGDSVRTDAKGAAKNSLDLLFITGSIHAKEIDENAHDRAKKIISLLAPSGVNLIGYQTILE